MSDILECHLDSHEETLLALLRQNPGSFDDWISTADSNAFWRRWTLQTQDICDAPLPPGSFERIADSKEDGATHEERGFANTARTLDRSKILPLDIFEQADVEDLGNIPETRNFVVPWSLGEDLTGGTVPEGFFCSKQALALDKGAFDLAIVDCWVDAAAYVHLNIGA